MYTFDNGELPKNFDQYFSDIASVHHKYQNTGLVTWKLSFTLNENVSGQFSLKVLYPNIVLIFLKIWNLSQLIRLESDTKATYYLVNFPDAKPKIVRFRDGLKRELLYCSQRSCFPYNFTSAVAHSTPRYLDTLFLCFSLLFLFTYFIWRWFDGSSYFCFTICATSSIKNWFVRATGQAEQLTHKVFRQPFCI